MINILKKISFFSLLIILIGATFNSCKKNDLTNTNNQSENLLEQSTINKLKVTDGILVFPDLKTFQDVYRLLDSTNAYEVFESNYGYTSLRSVISNEIEEFNKIYDPKNIKNPDDHFIADNTLRTLLNENCEVIIGTSIYKYLNKDLVAEILNLNFDISKKITADNYLSFEDNKEIILHGETTCKSTDCKANISRSGYTTTTTNGTLRRLYHKISVTNVIIISDRKITSKIKEEYYNGILNKWVLNSNSHINSNLKGFYYEGRKCGSIIKNLDWITTIRKGYWGTQKIKKNISKSFRVKSNMIYINVSTSNFASHNWYLRFN